MHNGEFRKALSYGNLATLEHEDSTFAYAFLAYLVDRGGQAERALAALREARAGAPDDVALLGAQSQILIDRNDARAALSELQAWRARNRVQEDLERLYVQALRGAALRPSSGSSRPLRDMNQPLPSPAGSTLAAVEAAWSRRWPAPYQASLPLANGSRFETASGVLIDGGRRVATVGSILSDARRILIRTSRGAVRTAHIESVSTDTGVAILRLDEPIADKEGDERPATAAPMPGSPCYVVGYLQRKSADPAWPALSAGLHGGWQAQPGGAVSATIGLSPGQFGAPALDRYGRLIGIATPAPSRNGASSSTEAVIQPIDDTLLREGRSTGAPQTAPQQEIYERGFALATLVVAVRD
jgi:S1-C subfamily serine protease